WRRQRSSPATSSGCATCCSPAGSPWTTCATACRSRRRWRWRCCRASRGRRWRRWCGQGYGRSRPATPNERGVQLARQRQATATEPLRVTTTETFDEYLDAIRAGERRRAFDVIRRAREEGIDLRTLYL